MSHTYGGLDLFPALLTMPDDGDAADAASVNVSLEGLADRTVFLLGRDATTTIFTAPGNFTAVGTKALLIGCGGGGGGGGGSTSSASASQVYAGGSGGGGALLGIRMVTTVPTTVYAVGIGAGGAGGATNVNGLPGGDTTFGALATFFGAGFGCGTIQFGFLGTAAVFTMPGFPIRTTMTPFFYLLSITDGTKLVPMGGAQHGGYGATKGFTWPSTSAVSSNSGGYGPTFTGNNAGINGTDGDVTHLGGGAGGGGGGGAFGAGGGIGGNGGNGNAAGAGAVGTAGTASGANTGGGGGGGGAGGTGTAGTPAGGAGGAGGSGALIVIGLP